MKPIDLFRAGFWSKSGGNGEGDPYWANVLSLLHFDGTNGSTTIVDATGRTGWGVDGTASIRTANSKFGGSSGGSIAAHGRFWSPTSSDYALGTGDFTIEGWVMPVGTLGDIYGRLVQFGPNSTNGGLWIVRDNTTNPARILVQVYSGGYVTIFLTSSSSTLPTDVFTHIAMTRESGVWRLFFGGVKVAETTYTGGGNNLTANYFMYGANHVNAESFYAYYDEFRITKGVARYTANFTPPTAPFPNHA